jgi:hypothetical protein
VPNWSISRNYKNILNSTKDSVTTGTFLTRRPCWAKPQVKGAQGPIGHTLSRFKPRLDGYTPKSVYKRIPAPKVGLDREEWPACHLDGHPTVHHLQTDSIKSVEAHLDPYIRITSTRKITLAPHRLSALPTLVCFLVFYQPMGKHLSLLVDVVFGFKSFSEAQRLARKCGTHRSDSLVRAL